MNNERLHEVFVGFSSYGHKYRQHEMTMQGFVKFCLECGLTDEDRFPENEISSLYSFTRRTRAEKTINYTQFITALHMISAKLSRDSSELMDMLCDVGEGVLGGEEMRVVCTSEEDMDFYSFALKRLRDGHYRELDEMEKRDPDSKTGSGREKSKTLNKTKKKTPASNSPKHLAQPRMMSMRRLSVQEASSSHEAAAAAATATRGRRSTIVSLQPEKHTLGGSPVTRNRRGSLGRDGADCGGSGRWKNDKSTPLDVVKEARETLDSIALEKSDARNGGGKVAAGVPHGSQLPPIEHSFSLKQPSERNLHGSKTKQKSKTKTTSKANQDDTKSQGPTPGPQQPAEEPALPTTIAEIFSMYSRGHSTMESSQWSRFIQDTNIVDKRGLKRNDAELIFSKVKGREDRKISLEQFDDALDMLASKKDVRVEIVLEWIFNQVEKKLKEKNAKEKRKKARESNDGGSYNVEVGFLPERPILANAQAMKACKGPLDLRGVFDVYSHGSGRIDGTQFSRLINDCQIIDHKLSRNEVDLIFSRHRFPGERRIGFKDFEKAIHEIGDRKGIAPEVTSRWIVSQCGRFSSSVINLNIYQKNDLYKEVGDSLYSGAYGERFNSSVPS